MSDGRKADVWTGPQLAARLLALDGVAPDATLHVLYRDTHRSDGTTEAGYCVPSMPERLDEPAFHTWVAAQGLKGPERPVQNVQSRAEVLAALEAIDLVVVFEEDTPRELIARVRPSVLIKGADYSREQVVGHDIVEAYGGEVLLVELLAGHSTTDIVKRSRSTAKS